jgi:oxalate---CoA ligase
MGFLESEEAQPAVALPASLSDLMTRFNVIEKPVHVPTYDFMWNNAAEEGREKLLLHQPFIVSASSQLHSSQAAEMHIYPDEGAYVGDAALKMTLATPNEIYDADCAAELLKSVGQEAVDIAVKGMLERGVISKLVRDPKKNKPGRQLKIADQCGFPVSPISHCN